MPRSAPSVSGTHHSSQVTDHSFLSYRAIVDIAATLGASRLILGAPRRNALVNILRGNMVREVSDLLPEEIDLLVYA